MPFGADRKMLYKADLDSIYFNDQSYSNVVRGCGSRCAFVLESTTTRLKATTGSRFSLDNRELTDHPILGRGYKMKSVNMSRVPNIQIASCHLNEVPGNSMPIYLHWLGLSRVRETNYFTNNEVAVINMVLNLTRLQLAKDENDRDETVTEELAKIKLFESNIKGQAGNHLKNKRYHLGSEAMLEFSNQFMLTLKYLAETTMDVFLTHINHFTTGMTIKKPLRKKLNVKYMKSFSLSLFHNCSFCASLAGCKGTFHNKPCLRRRIEEPHQMNMRYLTTMVEETTEEIYRIIREEVFVITKWPREDHDGGIQYHFDFGFEYSSPKADNMAFLLNGKLAKAKFRSYLQEPKRHVAFHRGPRIWQPGEEVTFNSDGDSSDEDSSDDDEVQEEGQEENREIMDEEDMGLYQTGEVNSPRQARGIRDETAGKQKCMKPVMVGGRVRLGFGQNRFHEMKS